MSELRLARQRWVGELQGSLPQDPPHGADGPARLRRLPGDFQALPREYRAQAILRFCQNSMRYKQTSAWWDQDGNRPGIELLDSSSVGSFRGYGTADPTIVDSAIGRPPVNAAHGLASGVHRYLMVHTGRP